MSPEYFEFYKDEEKEIFNGDYGKNDVYSLGLTFL